MRPGRGVAGISAFGFGGTNFHAVITSWSGAPAPRHGLAQWPVELFLFDAVGEIDRLLALCATNDTAGRPWRLRDLARTTAERPGSTRIAVVAADLDDLAAKLAVARDGRPGEGVFLAGADTDPASLRGGGELALLFPGQGSQRPGMLADLFVAFPRLQQLLRDGARWAPTMFPPSAFDAAGKEAQIAALKDTRVAQPALGIAGLAMFRTLSELGITPAHLAGHSYGELVALAAAGALDPAELFDLSEARGKAILAAAGEDPGTMAAVSGGAAEVRAVLNGGGVVVANLNSPTQTVISGPTAAVDRAVEALSAAGLRAQRIPVACAFHSPVVAEASRILEAELAGRTVGSPHLPVWANATAAPYPLGANAVRELLAEQVVSPVRFAEQIEAMYDAGARVFVECGPGGVLTGLVGAVLGDRPHTAVATDAPGRHGVHALLTALARLAVAGVEIDTALLYTGRDAQLVNATEVPRQAGWQVNGHLVMTADGAPVNGGLRPADRVTPVALAPAQPAPIAAAPSDGREAVVLEFLRNSRELLAAQREVVLGLLGAAPAAPIAAPIAPAQPVVAAAPAVTAQPVLPAPATLPAPVAVPDPAPVAAATTPQAVQDLLIDLISERTGYPAAMLDVDLDLEADLSIGSLKRTEIVGLLADRMRAAGLTGVPDENKQAELTRIRTLREIVAAVCRGLDAAPAFPVVPAQAGPVHDTVSAPASTAPDAATVATALVELIGERTGYPVAMLDADLDLEADLSIGSLKRTEIIGLLADRLAPAYRLDESLQAELTRLRTVRLITERIAGATPVAAPSVPAPTAAPQVEIGPAPAPAPARADRPAVHRYLLEPAPIEAAVATADLTGRHVTVVSGSPGVVIELCAALEEQGATVRTVSTDPAEELGDVDILVHLAASGPSEPPSLPEAFAALRRAVLGGARQLLVATGHGGRFGHRTVIDSGVRTDLPAGLGLAGLVRTIAREYPEISCRLVDLDPKDLPGLLAGHLVTELRTATGPELIGYTTEGRCTLSLVPAPLAAAGTAVRASDLGLSERSVVLLTGGARGITSRIAREIAETANCHIVLWGRTPLPVDEEAAATAGATDPAALRRALIEAGEKVPARVEAEVRRILAEREVRASLTGLRAHAASVDYTCVDVRDPVAVADAVAELMVRHGRVDGVVHGAGVLDDRLIADKTTDGFARVWETKVDGARALAAALSPDLRFLVLFGSVSGVFGNRGQCDYAAANDALDTLARSWEGRFTGRVLSVDWGPWAPADGAGDGMVSEELLRAYARQGVFALHPDDGVRAFLEELAHGSEPQVVYVCAEPSAFDAAFSDGRPAGSS